MLSDSFIISSSTFRARPLKALTRKIIQHFSWVITTFRKNFSITPTANSPCIMKNSVGTRLRWLWKIIHNFLMTFEYIGITFPDRPTRNSLTIFKNSLVGDIIFISIKWWWNMIWIRFRLQCHGRLELIIWIDYIINHLIISGQSMIWIILKRNTLASITFACNDVIPRDTRSILALLTFSKRHPLNSLSRFLDSFNERFF